MAWQVPAPLQAPLGMLLLGGWGEAYILNPDLLSPVTLVASVLRGLMPSPHCSSVRLPGALQAAVRVAA